MMFYTLMLKTFWSFLFSCFFLNIFKKKVGSVLKNFLIFDSFSKFMVFLTVKIVFFMVKSMPVGLCKSGSVLKVLMVVLMFLLMLSFLVNKFLFFFIFFEASLIPTFYIVLSWGSQPERVSASYYLVAYTLFGSLPLLMSIFYYFMEALNMKIYYWGTLNHKKYINMFQRCELSWILFFWLMGFFMKLPVYGFHMWLTKAHVEAPVVGSMVLAGVLLKLGGYGMFRLVELFSLLNSSWKVFIFMWSLLSQIMVSFICFRKKDLKLLMAYSSVAHMALCICGLMCVKPVGVSGVVSLLVAHGVCSSGLFWMVKIFYDFSGSRNMLSNRGNLFLYPVVLLFWVLLCLINASLPPSLKIFSEIFLFNSVMKFSCLKIFFVVVFIFLNGLFGVKLYCYIAHGPWGHLNYYWCFLSFRVLSVCFFHLLGTCFLAGFVNIFIG